MGTSPGPGFKKYLRGVLELTSSEQDLLSAQAICTSPLWRQLRVCGDLHRGKLNRRWGFPTRATLGGPRGLWGSLEGASSSPSQLLHHRGERLLRHGWSQQTGLLGSLGPGGKRPGDGDFILGWGLVRLFNRLYFLRTVLDL